MSFCLFIPHLRSKSIFANKAQNRLKLKRPQTARAFKAEIDRMYEEIAAQASQKPKL